MTPERKAEIDKDITWWRKQIDLRVNGFNIECNDPLFTPRVVPKPEPITILWCRIWMTTWLKFEKHFTFTGRIRYTRRLGKFHSMSFEIARVVTQKRWQNLWRESYETTTQWVAERSFEYREDFVNEYENIIVDHGKTITQ